MHTAAQRSAASQPCQNLVCCDAQASMLAMLASLPCCSWRAGEEGEAGGGQSAQGGGPAEEGGGPGGSPA